MKLNVIITAGGKSQRYGDKNKLFERCGNSCVLVEAIKPFLNVKEVSKVIVGIESSYADECAAALDMANLQEDTRIVFSQGGNSRTKTVKNALVSIDDDADFVLVHDGARPYVTEALIRKVVDCAKQYNVALPLAQMTDAMVDVTKRIQPVDRQNYRRVQTPFCAKREIFIKAYSALSDADLTKSVFYDDLSVIKTCFSDEIGIVEGDMRNIKITYPSDLQQGNEMLTGCGYDIHRMTKGDGIKLLGVKIPCEFSFIAHSDGDVPVHAIMDAILSAIGEKDIGHLFPVDDPRFEGADSTDLLKQVLELAHKKGYEINNVSVSIIAQQPMLAAYIDNMCTRMSAVMNLPIHKIGVSATTNEEVGEIGGCKAIAAYATVLLSRAV